MQLWQQGESSSPGGAFQPRSSLARESSSPAPFQPQSSPVPFQPRSSPARESSSPAPFQAQSSPGRFQPRSSRARESSSPVSFQPRSSPVREIRPRRPSPVLYRHNPLDYEPARLCGCNEKAGIFISWTDFPGRRYLNCMRPPSDRNRCQFFDWYDEVAFPQYITNLLGDLRDKVDEKERELVVLREQLQSKEQELQGSLEEMMHQLWK